MLKRLPSTLKGILLFTRAVVTKIVGVTGLLAEFPFSGRVVPELGDSSFREHFAFSYRIIYRIEEEQITIAAIIHGRRLLGDVDTE